MHHTKDKGDLAVAMVIADLAKQGITVCMPISEHLPFDLIAVSADYRIVRVQVKHCKLVGGISKLMLYSTYSDSSGKHKNFTDRSSFDAYAVYVPDVEKILYVPVGRVEGYKFQFNIRCLDALNKQFLRTNLMKDFLDPTQMFASVV